MIDSGRERTDRSRPDAVSASPATSTSTESSGPRPTPRACRNRPPVAAVRHGRAARSPTENDANCVAIAANHLLAPASGDLVAVTLGHRDRRWHHRRRRVRARATRLRGRTGAHGDRPDRSAVPLRSARVLGALRVGLRPPLPGPPCRRSGQRRRRSPAGPGRSTRSGARLSRRWSSRGRSRRPKRSSPSSSATSRSAWPT